MPARTAWLALLTGAFVVVTMVMTAPVQAQQLGLPRSAILTISQERFFTESDFGKRVLSEIETETERLAEEDQKLAAELTKEERDLTERRPDMTPEEFRALADAFDAKVQEIRATQDAKFRALNQMQEDARAKFFRAAQPVLAGLMRETGASVILERSSVFLSSNATDITDTAIQRMNAVIGDGGETAQPQD